jgi:hypothetical protein
VGLAARAPGLRVTRRNEGSGLSPRREAFARAVVEGASGAEAARKAGYAERSARQQAHRLLTNDDVRARIDELLSEAVARVPVTLESHLEQLRVLQKRAETLGQYGVAIRAVEIRCRVLGYFREPPKPKSTLLEAGGKLPSGEQVELLLAALRRLRREAPGIAAMIAEELLDG